MSWKTLADISKVGAEGRDHRHRSSSCHLTCLCHTATRHVVSGIGSYRKKLGNASWCTPSRCWWSAPGTFTVAKDEAPASLVLSCYPNPSQSIMEVWPCLFSGIGQAFPSQLLVQQDDGLSGKNMGKWSLHVGLCLGILRPWVARILTKHDKTRWIIPTYHLSNQVLTDSTRNHPQLKDLERTTQPQPQNSWLLWWSLVKMWQSSRPLQHPAQHILWGPELDWTLKLYQPGSHHYPQPAPHPNRANRLAHFAQTLVQKCYRNSVLEDPLLENAIHMCFRNSCSNGPCLTSNGTEKLMAPQMDTGPAGHNLLGVASRPVASAKKLHGPDSRRVHGQLCSVLSSYIDDLNIRAYSNIYKQCMHYILYNDCNV